MLATILAASILVMGVTSEICRSYRVQREDTEAGDFEPDGDGNEGNFSEGGSLLVAQQQAAQIHLHQSNKNTGYLDV